jgi:ferredoxin
MWTGGQVAYREQDGGWYRPQKLAVVNPSCDGCGGSPICMEACPPAEMARGCIVLMRAPDNVSGIVGIDPDVCTGCGLCAYHGPALMLTPVGTLRPQDVNARRVAGCPWEALDMVRTTEWEKAHGPLAEGASVFDVAGDSLARDEVHARSRRLQY